MYIVFKCWPTTQTFFITQLFSSRTITTDHQSFRVYLHVFKNDNPSRKNALMRLFNYFQAYSLASRLPKAFPIRVNSLSTDDSGNERTNEQTGIRRNCKCPRSLSVRLSNEVYGLLFLRSTRKLPINFFSSC